MGTHDQQPAQIAIAPFRDAAEPLLAARRGLSRRQPKKGSERARARESGDILNTRAHRRGRHRAQAGNGHEPARRFLISGHRGDGSIAARDLLIQSVQLTHERSERHAHAGRNRRVFFHLNKPCQFPSVLEPLRRDNPTPDQAREAH